MITGACRDAGERMPRTKRTTTTMYRIAAWSQLYDVATEPGTDAAQYAQLYAMKFLRLWLPGTVEGNWVEGQFRSIVRSGGYELLGIAMQLLRMAGAHRGMSGALTNHLGLPASLSEIAEELRLPTATARAAVNRLCRRDVRFLVAEQGFGVNAMAAMAAATLARQALVAGQVTLQGIWFNVSEGWQRPRPITRTVFEPWKGPVR